MQALTFNKVSTPSIAFLVESLGVVKTPALDAPQHAHFSAVHTRLDIAHSVLRSVFGAHRERLQNF